jgi:hypothetical protein
MISINKDWRFVIHAATWSTGQPVSSAVALCRLEQSWLIPIVRIQKIVNGDLVRMTYSMKNRLIELYNDIKQSR